MRTLLIRWSCLVLFVLVIAGCSSGTSHHARAMGPVQEGRYLVSQRDTLESIAKSFSTTVEWLKQRNQVDEKTLSPGQIILVPSSSAQPWR